MSVPADAVFRQQIAADMFDGLVDSGMAVRAKYTAPGDTPPADNNCIVVISRGQVPSGSFGTVPANKTQIKLLLQQIPAPTANSTIAEDGATFKLVKELTNDGALSTWEVAK